MINQCKSKYIVDVVCIYLDIRVVIAFWSIFEFGNSCTGWSEGIVELLGVQGCLLIIGSGNVSVKLVGGIFFLYFFFIVEFQ